MTPMIFASGVTLMMMLHIQGKGILQMLLRLLTQLTLIYRNYLSEPNLVT